MLVTQAHIVKMSTLVDGSARLAVDLPELTPEKFSEVGRVNRKMGILVFKPDVEAISQKELDAIKQTNVTGGLGDKKKKSKSQVLRQVLFRKWEQEPEGFETQQAHYDFKMDEIITHFKGLLEED